MEFEDAIATQLAASWNIIVIAKPAMKVGGPENDTESNKLIIREDETGEYNLLTLDGKDTLFRIAYLSINCLSDNDVKAYLSEIRRIINAYIVADSEEWHVLRRVVRKMDKKRLLIVTAQSKQYGV